jgi:2-C-methyl-D-erythritol 4-phosphate cytidylyltransferase
MASKVAVIICAAGASSRFGGRRKKPFMDVGGRAAFLYSVELFSARDDVKQILLAIPKEEEELGEWEKEIQIIKARLDSIDRNLLNKLD